MSVSATVASRRNCWRKLITRCQLVLDAAKTQYRTTIVDVRRLRNDFLRGERSDETFEPGVVHVTAVGIRELHGWHGFIKIRHGEQQTQQHRGEHEQVHPYWIAIHQDTVRVTAAC